MNKKVISILLIVLGILSTTIIYSSFNENLIIDGEAYVRVDESIRVTDVNLTNTTNDAYETYEYKYSKDDVDLYVTLPKLTSTITYQINIINSTDYTYVIGNIDSSLSNSNITYTIDYEEGDTLTTNGITTISITFKYDSRITTLPSDTTGSFNISFSFIKLKFTIDGESVNSLPSKDDGYLTADVSCDNDTTAKWDLTNWWITNISSTSNSTCTINFSRTIDFDYTGGGQTYTILISGTYKLETWGAQGSNGLTEGTIQSVAGYGGYSTGEVTLTAGDILYINVGGQGEESIIGQDSAGGYNGGGLGTWDNNDNEVSGGGGGATHIATKSGLLSTLKNYQDNILIVSGGGGGSSAYADGGSGGGYIGSNGVDGEGATQTTGYAFGLGQSGIGNGNGNGVAGGGGGYYGGFTCEISGKETNAAGGGSGYIGNSLLTNKSMYCYECEESTDTDTYTVSTTNVSETATSEYAKSGNGYARITYLGL